MTFKLKHKGYKSWLGKKFSSEHRLKLSLSHKKPRPYTKTGKTNKCLLCKKEFYVEMNRIENGWGKFCCVKCKTEFNKGKPIEWFKGIKYKANSGSFKKGFEPWNKNKKGYSTSKKGKPQYHLRGEKNKLWNGYSKERDSWHSRIEYKLWRKSVFERDNYTCWICEKRGTNINAHHLKSWVKYPKLRFNINNGMTLCRWCHKTYTNFNENHKYKKIDKYLRSEK
jgi:hypothetical protein